MCVVSSKLREDRKLILYPDRGCLVCDLVN